MVMLEQRIQQQFFESADLQYQTAESLARPIADAAQALIGCVTAGGGGWLVTQPTSQPAAKRISSLDFTAES